MLHARPVGSDREADWNDVEDTIRKLTISLIGAAAVGASILLVRQQKLPTPQDTALQDTGSVEVIPPGETSRVHLSLDRLRELGL